MMTTLTTRPLGESPPDNPVGAFEEPGIYSEEIKRDRLKVLRDAAENLRHATEGLNDEQVSFHCRALLHDLIRRMQ